MSRSGNFGCAVCGARYQFAIAPCGTCGRAAVIWDGKGDKEEREESERRHAKEQEEQRTRAQAEAAAQAQRRSKGSSPPATSKANWNTPLGAVGFIVAGIALAMQGLDGIAILAGAVIAGVVCGVFYRQILALAAVGVGVWLLVLWAGSEERRATDSSGSGPNVPGAIPSLPSGSQPASGPSAGPQAPSADPMDATNVLTRFSDGRPQNLSSAVQTDGPVANISYAEMRGPRGERSVMQFSHGAIMRLPQGLAGRLFSQQARSSSPIRIARAS